MLFTHLAWLSQVYYTPVRTSLAHWSFRMCIAKSSHLTEWMLDCLTYIIWTVSELFDLFLNHFLVLRSKATFFYILLDDFKTNIVTLPTLAEGKMWPVDTKKCDQKKSIHNSFIAVKVIKKRDMILQLIRWKLRQRWVILNHF